MNGKEHNAKKIKQEEGDVGGCGEGKSPKNEAMKCGKESRGVFGNSKERRGYENGEIYPSIKSKDKGSKWMDERKNNNRQKKMSGELPEAGWKTVGERTEKGKMSSRVNQGKAKRKSDPTFRFKEKIK